MQQSLKSESMEQKPLMGIPICNCIIILIVYLSINIGICVITLFVLASNYSNSAVSLLWVYYCEHLSLANKDYVLSAYHDKLTKLPWEEFFPDLSSIEYMIKVCTHAM